MCDALENNYIFNENEITYVRKYVVKEIGEDMDLLLKIEAEAQDDDLWQYNAIKISLLALVFSAIGVSMQFIPNIGSIRLEFIINTIYFVLLMLAIIKIGLSEKYETVGKWRMYVLIVIQRRIKELEK